ncbi:hypothetical protein [Streptomyces sp. NPDC056061]|uniref:hypothetical protein n=1 Tax=Streptomyces sp. NPDC056061 TaxID=3345700 RepID=UPI0035DD8435
MREIMTGCDIDNRISFHGHGTHVAQYPWPDETGVSAGAGVVFRRDPKPGEAASYTTLFMEVYPPGAAFIRGEGTTPQECEDNAWTQYQLALNCTNGSSCHDWEARGYRNGVGFCSRCDTFGSRVFSGEQLGQFCRVCNVGTTYYWEQDETTGECAFLCEDHYERPASGPGGCESLKRLFEELFGEPEKRREDATITDDGREYP